MGWWNKLLGGGVKEAGEGIKSAGEGVKTVIDSSGSLINTIRTSLTGVDAQSKARIEEALTQLQGDLQQGRQKIEEIIALAGAQHKNPFVAVFLAGWRPFIGWVAGWSLFFYFIPQFILGSLVWVRAAWMAVPYYNKVTGVLMIPEIPSYPISADGLLELVFGMLGLIIARSIDKRNKTTNIH